MATALKGKGRRLMLVGVPDRDGIVPDADYFGSFFFCLPTQV
jgi:hypothetical protein